MTTVRASHRTRPCPGAARLLAIMLAISPIPAHATTWVARYEGPRRDMPAALALGPAGSIYVAGASEDSTNGFDIVTIKYDAGGGTVWLRRYDGPAHGDDVTAAIVVAADGSVYVTGSSRGAGTDDDCVTLKYDDAGTLLWSRRYSGPGEFPDHGEAIALTTSNGVVVGGTSYVEGERFNQLLIGYASDGTEQWSRSDDGGSGTSDAVRAVAALPSGGVAVAGIVADSAGVGDYAVRAIDASGTVAWTRRYNGPAGGYDWPAAISVTPAGRIYVTGESQGTASVESATLGFSATGDSLWTSRFDGPGNLLDGGFALRTTGDGRIYVAGVSEDSVTSSNILTLCYDDAGTLLWSRTFDDISGIDEAGDLTIDPAGRVIVTGKVTRGASEDTVDCDFATIAYSAAGDTVWRWTYDGPAGETDIPAAVVADDAGAYFVTGESQGVGTGLDFATIRFDSSTSLVSVPDAVHPPALGIRLRSANPGSGSIELDVDFPAAGALGVAVFDVQGRRAPVGMRATPMDPGSHRIRLGTTRLPAGTYLLRITGHTGARRIDEARKLTLLH